MKKSFSLFLALRYLKPKRTFVSVITLISILGVTLGIMVLIVVISVMKGFELELQKKVIGFDAHIVVSQGGGLNYRVMDDWEDVAKVLESIPGVVSVAPTTDTLAIASFQNKRRVPIVRGVDPEMEARVADIEKYIVAGHYDLDGDKCLVGADLAYALELKIGDKVQFTSGGNLDEVIAAIDEAEKQKDGDAQALENIRQLVLPTDLTVSGIFESGRYDYDNGYVFVPLYVGQEMSQIGGGVHALAVKTADPFQADVVKKEIMKRLGWPYLAQTWVDRNKVIFDAIRTERDVMFFILMFIILVAAFGIMNTLITVTVQKTREIGILKALGARTGQIIGVFAFQGMVVGFFGTLIGLAAGMLVVQFRNEAREGLAKIGIHVFSPEVYMFNKIPAMVEPSDVALICVSAFVICSVAALIPAYFAARLDPVKALRYE